ncbi:MAG: 4Fe-4S ferredoxin [Clostridia bacterium]|nr:MAG: 4Fe-4S ferredoxin [Clostridia bacterium]
MYVLDKSQLPSFLEAMAAGRTVFVPAEAGGMTRFVPWQAGIQLYWEENPVISPKELFFPQTQVLYGYRTLGQQLEILSRDEGNSPRVIFGLRPCDAAATGIMDDVFLTKGYEDSLYRSRRQNTLLVVLACRRPGPACFCTSFGLDPTRADNADLMLYDLGAEWGLEAVSPAGQDLLAKPAGPVERQAAAPEFAGDFPLEIKVDHLPSGLRPMFRHQVWDIMYQKCLGCGTCTYLCPVCHCFDIQSHNRGVQGYRYRCWDSCMFSDYTLMAGGANPRPTKKERVRNRFLHKLQFMPERYGKFGCVGCGRCVLKCPVNLDITQVANRLAEVVANA